MCSGSSGGVSLPTPPGYTGATAYSSTAPEPGGGIFAKLMYATLRQAAQQAGNLPPPPAPSAALAPRIEAPRITTADLKIPLPSR